ncbi:MAG TPA: zf-HC2 domain-containing protein [Candidatus Sulfotelmatobacter sp.]|nr:zf-HC2 domain-containing protein [Candidatus Sulfotelmatobacter sp.]
MECYSEQICAIFVDGELGVDEARRLRDHLSTCRRCQKLVDALHAENNVLGESLQELPEEAASPASFPRWRRSWLWGDLAAMAAVLTLGSIFFLWMDGLRIPEAMEWLNPFSLGGLTNLIFNVSYYFTHGGTAMLADYAAVVGGILLVGGGALLLGRRSRLNQPGLRLLIVVLVLSLPSFALERRHGEFVTVAANETLDDNLLATGNTVRVEGVVNGDLLAFGQTVEVSGSVKGDLISFAKRTVVSGTVEGRIFDFSQSLDLDGQLGHSIYGWVQSLRVGTRGHVGDGIVVGAGDVSLEGDVKRSVTIFAGNADVSSSIGRDLTMNGGGLTLTDSARVGGNLSARVRELRDVHIAEGATIAGKRDLQVRAMESEFRSRFTRPRFYFYQVVWVAAAMLVGWLGLVLFPGFFEACTQAVGAGWRSLGLGIGVLAGAPVAMIVIAITLVGLPISFMLLAVYLVAIYLAKIWVGAFLGRLLLKPAGGTKGEWILGLLLGLVILTVVGFIPYLGGLVRFGMVCLGLGAFSWQLYRGSRPAMTA